MNLLAVFKHSRGGNFWKIPYFGVDEVLAKDRSQKAAATRQKTMSCMQPLPKAVGIALAVCVLTGLAVALLPLESRAQQPVIGYVRDSDPAPELKARDLDSKELSIEAFKGNAVLLNF